MSAGESAGVGHEDNGAAVDTARIGITMQTNTPHTIGESALSSNENITSAPERDSAAAVAGSWPADTLDLMTQLQVGAG